jgi:hypothetical protein
MKSVVSVVGVLAISAATICALSGPAAFAEPAPTARSFEGVWKVTKVVKTGDDAGVNTHPQPSLQIFYRGYYSIVRDISSEPRQPSPAAQNPTTLTDEEKLARYAEWAPFAASAGTYEIKGDRLITHNIVAKNVRAATITEEATFSFEGDTFVASVKSAPGAPVGERQTTYTRVR